MVTLQLRQLDVPPGQRVLFHDVGWDEFEAILEELGKHRSARIAYDNGVIEIMAPLPIHEDDKEIVSDLLKAFLEELDIEFRTLGSTTFKNEVMLKGIEPDQCFYIQGDLIQIYYLQSGQYIEVEDSPTFSGWYLHTVIPGYVKQSRTIGRNKMMKAFRAWVNAELEKRS